MKKISVKKTLGVVGFFLVFFLAGRAVWASPDKIEIVLWPLITLVLILFGFKTFGGALIQKIQNGKKE